MRSAVATAAALCLLASTSLATAEVTQDGNLRVSFTGGISPHALPRQGRAPVEVRFGGEIKTVDGAPPPQLQTISLAINRHGKIDHRGLPVCHYHQIQPASTREAIGTCPGSVIGKGRFSADVLLPEQSPFPSVGEVTAFNGVFHGRHVVFAHVYGTAPLPQSQVLVFELGRTSGTYRTTLTAQLPRVAAEWGYVSGISLRLDRVFRYRGQLRSFVAAGCPALAGTSLAIFDFARASFGFEDGRTLGVTMTSTCKVKRETEKQESAARRFSSRRGRGQDRPAERRAQDHPEPPAVAAAVLHPVENRTLDEEEPTLGGRFQLGRARDRDGRLLPFPDPIEQCRQLLRPTRLQRRGDHRVLATAPEDRGEGRRVLVDVVEVGVQAGVQPLDRRERLVRREARRQLFLPTLDRRDDELSLGRKVVIQQAFRDSRRFGDLLDRDLCVRAPAQQRDSRVEQLLPPSVGAHSQPSRRHQDQASSQISGLS